MGSVRTAVPKDAFVVHSKSDALHAELVDGLGATLKSFGRSLWQYSDWDWEATRKGAVGYRWSGRINEFDPARHIAGEAPFRHRQEFQEVDEESLDELIETSRVLILLSPSSGGLSSGSVLETERIVALQRRAAEQDRRGRLPLIVVAGPTSSPPSNFVAIAPALGITLTDNIARSVNRLAAVFVNAWIVHTLQTTYGAPGQHLLSLIATHDRLLHQLITGSPNHRTLDFNELEERSRSRARTLDEPVPKARWHQPGNGMVAEPDHEDMGHCSNAWRSVVLLR